LNQAAPVQNTWYTILDTTTDVMIYDITVNVEDANETLEVRLTIDSEMYTGSIAATHSTEYEVAMRTAAITRSTYLEINGGVDWEPYNAFTVIALSVKVEVRKTTAAGAGNLTGIVNYARKPE
jgi:hypothetical protein